VPTLPELNGRQGAFPLLCTTTGLLCLAAFLLLARLDWTDVVPPWDVGIAASVQGWSLPGILPFMLAVSWPGWSPQSWILVLAICGVLYWRGLKLAAPLALVAAVSHVIVRGIKGSINRLRPDLGLMPDGPLDPSFPSGHATQYTIFLGLLAYLAWRRLRPGWSRSLAVSVCLGLIVLVGPSRVYLGQHWPSDVLAGYLLGSGLLLLIIAAIEWHQSRLTRVLPWALTRRNRTR
jgi:undecaprenyl-diphosphatase